MYRVLIAEDKRITREGLVKLTDWAGIGARVVFACDNGEAAAAYLRENEVDLVLTDIRMEPMDGLALAALVRRGCPRAKVLIISAYQDFDYAHRALELGVCGYVLKPVDERELLEKAAQAFALIESERDISTQLTQWHRKRLADLLLEQITGLSASRAALCACLAEAGRDPERLTAVLFIVKNFGCAVLPGAVLSYFERVRDKCVHCLFDDLAVGLYFGPLEEFQAHQAANTAFLQRAEGSEALRMCVSSTVYTAADLRGSFLQVLDAYHYSFLYGLGPVVYAADAAGRLPNPPQLSFFRYDVLQACFAGEDRTQLERYAGEVFDSFVSGGCPVSFITRQCAELSARMDTLTRKHGLYLDPAFPALLGAKSLKSFPTLALLRDYVLGILLDVFDSAMQHRSSRMRPIVRRALDYAMERLEEPGQNLKEIAGALRVSYVYLSKAFKEDCGVSFTSYMNAQRIERAKKLLAEDPACRAQDICDRIGMEPKNFYHLFKKLEHVTPLEYQRRARGE